MIMEQYGDLIVACLTLLSGIIGVLYLRAQTALKRQDRAIQEIKSDAATRDQQIKLTQQLAESNAKRELLYTQQSSRQQELWQKSIDNLALSITTAITDLTVQQREDRRELLRDQKEDRQRFIEKLDQNTTVVKNIQEVMEVWVLKTAVLDDSIKALITRGERTLDRLTGMYQSTTENSDHLLLTVEAIRDRIFLDKDSQLTHNSLVQTRLDEILLIIKMLEPKGEVQHES